jgi:hypothetical protein
VENMRDYEFKIHKSSILNRSTYVHFKLSKMKKLKY